MPTIAFGVPGSASMAILLGAFLIHGLVPGPEMLREKLDVTYAIVWSVAFANIFGAGICFLFSDQLAKIALVRFSIIMPMILTVIMIGAFQARRDWGDLIAVIAFGILGSIMKRLKWPRPPIILGAPVPLHSLPDTLHCHGLPVPGVIAEDPVGLRYCVPALDIGKGQA